jgi:hypothetical protein
MVYFLRCYYTIFSEFGVLIDEHLGGSLGLAKKTVREAKLTEPPL